MDEKVLEVLVGTVSSQDLDAVMDITSLSIRLYEETLKAMGLTPIPVSAITVDNSQVQYAAPLDVEINYADVPANY